MSTPHKTKSILKAVTSFDYVGNAKLAYRTIRDLVLVFVPFALAWYVLATQSDRIVRGIGVALALWSIFEIVKLAYRLEVQYRS